MTKVDVKRLRDYFHEGDGFDYQLNYGSSFEDVKDEEFHYKRLSLLAAREEFINYLAFVGIEVD